jgi:hypothetical protein
MVWSVAMRVATIKKKKKTFAEDFSLDEVQKENKYMNYIQNPWPQRKCYSKQC